jgi:hypothetical protein
VLGCEEARVRKMGDRIREDVVLRNLTLELERDLGYMSHDKEERVRACRRHKTHSSLSFPSHLPRPFRTLYIQNASPTRIIAFPQLVPTKLKQFFADSKELIRFDKELSAEKVLAEVEVEESYGGAGGKEAAGLICIGAEACEGDSD